MKLRKFKKKEYIFFPPDGSKLTKVSYVFKRKDKLMKFLNGHIDDSINGIVRVYNYSFGSSGHNCDYFIWYNEKQYNSGADLKVDLRKMDKKKRKPFSVSKNTKLYFAFSNRRIELMSIIGNTIDKGENINPSHAKNLVEVFYKSGFKDFEPDQETLEYINSNIEEGIPFFYWSDRCNYVRMKAVIEYFKRNNLI